MFTQIIHKQFEEYDDLLSSTGCPNVGEYKITVAGVGKTGIDQISRLNRHHQFDISFDTLTMFSYDIHGNSNKREQVCKNAIADCLGFYVLLDFEDASVVESACKLAEYSKNAGVGTHLNFNACVTLKKYYGTNIAKRISDIFDKVIYVDTSDQFFMPIRSIFPLQGYVGFDYRDHYDAIKESKNIFLVHINGLELKRIYSCLHDIIDANIKKYNIEKMNVITDFSVYENSSIEPFYDVVDIVRAVVKSKYEKAIDTWTVNTHPDNDLTIKTTVMLCTVE